MERGRKPTPSDLRVILGNPGHRPIREDIKPQGEVVKPKSVTGAAAKLWKKYAPSLEAAGVLTSWDVDMFGAWCRLMALFDEEGPERFTSAKLTQLRTLGESFCLLPPGRSRLKPNSSKNPADKKSAKFYA